MLVYAVVSMPLCQTDISPGGAPIRRETAVLLHILRHIKAQAVSTPKRIRQRSPPRSLTSQPVALRQLLPMGFFQVHATGTGQFGIAEDSGLDCFVLNQTTRFNEASRSLEHKSHRPSTRSWRGMRAIWRPTASTSLVPCLAPLGCKTADAVQQPALHRHVDRIAEIRQALVVDIAVRPVSTEVRIASAV